MLFSLYLVNKVPAWKEHHFCNPIYLPIYLPSIFCFFLEGALGLADPYVPFLFHWLFLLIAYLALPLFLPRPQIKQLGTLVSLPNYWSAKIKQWTDFFLYSTTENWNMAWSRLDCWTIHQNLVNMKACTHLALSWKYGIFVSAKQSIFGIWICQSWNMKPIGIGIQQWLHMGMVFLLERPRTAGQNALALDFSYQSWKLFLRTSKL